ncbi:sporulation membrane protein YtaF [Bacillus marinisedimentorum]|uniref:sporulation membrane protein YtaF n=1 Tax=Bacillus marinisedimentorum TaxID=1821260 RepID=UPI000871D49B|nr:sporulation membrane protein YtaF [Bacillus marinisedimentorum]
MMQIIPLIMLAFAVSLDSFNVGFTYGMRGMKIPHRSIAIIAVCSAASMLLAMTAGKAVSTILSPETASHAGGLVLILIGIWVIYQFFKQEHSDRENNGPLEFKFEVKSLGLVISILRKPMSADMDRSGEIRGIEAVLLGTALALDAFGAGLGAAMLDFSPLITAFLTAAMSSLLVLGGMKTGMRLANTGLLKKVSLLPGFILIMLGVWRM